MSPRLPSVSSKKVVATLLRAGFYVHHQEGSHIALRSSEDESVRVVVPANRKDLKKGTLKSIINQSGLTAEEFIELLKA